MKVTLNGKTGTASAMVKQEANVVESFGTNWGAAYVNVQSTEFDSSGGTASVTVEPVEGKESKHTPPGRRLTWGEDTDNGYTLVLSGDESASLDGNTVTINPWAGDSGGKNRAYRRWTVTATFAKSRAGGRMTIIQTPPNKA